jgi:hypothetical protein
MEGCYSHIEAQSLHKKYEVCCAHIEAQSLHKEMHSCYAHIAAHNLCIRNGKFLRSKCSAQFLHTKWEVPMITLKHNLCIKHVRLPILILKHNLGMRNRLQFLHTEF